MMKVDSEYDVTWMSPFLDLVLLLIPSDVKSIIDLGAGRGIVGALLKIYRRPLRVVGVEIWEPYLHFLKETNLYDEVVRHDLQVLPYPFADKEYDMAIALEVIEHLPRIQGIKMLHEMERIAKTVIVSTPNVHWRQAKYEGNPYQAHHSFWKVSDFVERGYVVLGYGLAPFGKVIPGMSYVLGRTTLLLPRFSSTIIAVKDPSVKTRLDLLRRAVSNARPVNRQFL